MQQCRVCGCSDDDCSACIERTGRPCHWVEEDLCSACDVPVVEPESSAAVALGCVGMLGGCAVVALLAWIGVL